MPVWADAFGTEKQKSIWLTFLLLGSPVGVITGYILTYYMDMYFTWEWSFYIQAMVLIPCSIVMFLIPHKYLDISFTQYFKQKCHERANNEIYIKTQ